MEALLQKVFDQIEKQKLGEAVKKVEKFMPEMNNLDVHLCNVPQQYWGIEVSKRDFESILVHSRSLQEVNILCRDISWADRSASAPALGASELIQNRTDSFGLPAGPNSLQDLIARQTQEINELKEQIRLYDELSLQTDVDAKRICEKIQIICGAKVSVAIQTQPVKKRRYWIILVILIVFFSFYWERKEEEEPAPF